jgi:hypothetical protein
MHSAIPLLRFADDILLPCRTAKEARTAYAALAGLVRAAGFELKEAAGEAVRPVARGEEVRWMGYGVRGTAGGLAYAVTDGAWESLRESLAQAHGRPNSPVAALRSIAGWVADKGPCYVQTHLDRACERVERLAGEQGFEEVPGRDELKGLWQRAAARWGRLRKQVRENCRRTGAVA